MKKTLTFLILIFAYFNLSAQNTTPYCPSSLSVELPNNNRYEIFIDGVSFGFLDNRRVVHNIPNGKRFIQILEKTNSRSREQNKAVTFFMVFNECQNVFTRLERNGKITVLETQYKEDISNHEQFEIIYVDSQQNNEISPNTEFPNSGGQTIYPPISTQYPDNAPAPMHPDSFMSFIQSVRTMSHDHSKQEIAEMGISANYFTSAQVLELVRQFSHDHTKLEVAKMAFHKTVDPQNYTMLFPTFSHDHTRQELSRYIRGHY